ncbi:hypothetical protein QJQ45_013715 [Haematococcus lacustris]|nr:hypothetical protein QJQ45_013715 [Haematococcus lacustris]
MAISKQDLAGLARVEDVAPSGSRAKVAVDKNAPWVEKYRPKSLDDVAAHKGIIDTIKRLTSENRLPHLLFYGPPGTGKTSTILAVARQIYGSSLQNMTLELNASDDRGIAVVRQEIQDFASTKTIFASKFKLIILDECDAMTKDAQNALRRVACVVLPPSVIEKYTRNARFCLICNYVSKIVPAVQSRCTKFRFAPLDPAFVHERLRYVVQAEGVKMGPGGLDALVALGGGDMRRSLNILQSCHMAFPEVDSAAVYLCTGNPEPADIKQALHWLLNEELAVAYAKLIELQLNKGIALADIVRELHPWMFQLELPPRVRISLVEGLADLEHRLSVGTSERLQLGSLCALFCIAKDSIAASAVQ